MCWKESSKTGLERLKDIGANGYLKYSFKRRTQPKICEMIETMQPVKRKANWKARGPVKGPVKGG